MLGFQALGKDALGELTTVSAGFAESGSFVVTGNTSLLSSTRVAGIGEFALTGQSASRVLSMRGEIGSFVHTGIAANLASDRRLVALPSILTYPKHFLFSALGELVLGGSSSSAQDTTFVLLANNVNFNIDNPLIAEQGEFVLTFVDGTLLSPIRPPNIRIFPRVAFGMRASGRGGGMVANASSGANMRARAFGG